MREYWLSAAEAYASHSLSGDQRKPEKPPVFDLAIRRLCCFLTSSSQSSRFLSWYTIHLPSGDTTPSKRNILPSWLSGPGLPMPLAGSVSNSSSPVSSESTNNDLPSGRKAAS